VGCVGVRPLSTNASAAATLQQHQHAACQPGLRPLQLGAACELKRLWLSAELHASGLGRALVSKAIDRARAAGCYTHMVLETLESLPAAVKLYERVGFVRRKTPFTHNPLPDVVQFELEL
jgi:ribosomal protein S18 acetylase RimI-like enzyme